MEYAAAHGLLLDDWQADVVDAGMVEQAGGDWAALVVAIIAARRNGKNFAAYARELYGLGVLGEEVIHTAQLFKTTKESYNDILKFVEAGPLGEMLVHRVASPGTGYTMWFANGGRIDFIARSATSGRGLNADLLVLDEAQDLDDDELGALVPTQAARPNPQAWYLGSAPGPTAVVWQRMRRAGRAGEVARQAFFEFSADPAMGLDDPVAWRQANPGLVCGRLNVSVIESERQQMSDEMFARERLSVSPDIGEGDTTLAGWTGLTDATSVPAGDLRVAVDVSPGGLSTAIAGAGLRADGLEHVEVVEHRPRMDWVVGRLLEAKARHPSMVVVLDPAGPAGALVAPLEASGFVVRQVSVRDAVAAAGSFAEAVTGGHLRHRGQRSLNAAVSAARRRDVGDGGWAWGRKASSSDISPLVAVTLARWAIEAVQEEARMFAGEFYDPDDEG